MIKAFASRGLVGISLLAMVLVAVGAGADGRLRSVVVAAAVLATVQAVGNLVPRHSTLPLTLGVPSDGLQAWCQLRRR